MGPLRKRVDQDGKPSVFGTPGKLLQKSATSIRVYSRICALILMTTKLRAQPANAYLGSRTPGAGAVLLSTRQTEDKKLDEREKAMIWGIRNGIAHTAKNMRRVRLFVVPPLQPWYGVLQRVPGKAGEVSQPRDTEASRPAGKKAID